MEGISYLYGGVGRIGELESRRGMGTLGGVMTDRPMTIDETKRVPFKDLLVGSVAEVNMLQQKADQAVEKLMTGGEIGTAEVLTAVQKADIAFKMMMQMRNKLVGAYQEIQAIRV
jgi:flagellar hook-basal body complex protein FliE